MTEPTTYPPKPHIVEGAHIDSMEEFHERLPAEGRLDLGFGVVEAGTPPCGVQAMPRGWRTKC